MRRMISLLLTGALLVLTACGDEKAQPLTHAEYLAALHRIERSAAARDIGQQFFELVADGVTPAACQAGARQFAQRARRIVAEVARLEPPADAEDLQRRFLAAAEGTVDQLDRLADDSAAGRVACGMPWNRRAYGLASTLAAERVIADHGRRGYQLDGNGD